MEPSFQIAGWLCNQFVFFLFSSGFKLHLVLVLSHQLSAFKYVVIRVWFLSID